MGNNTDNKHLQDTSQINLISDTIPKILTQDTTTVSLQDTVLTEDTITGQGNKQYSFQEALQIFEREQQHGKKVDSIHKASITEAVTNRIIPKKNTTEFQPDSSEIFITINENQGTKPLFFNNMWKHNKKNEPHNKNFFISSEYNTDNNAALTGTEIQVKNPEKFQSAEEIPSFWNNWVPGIILFSFILLVWVKLFYNKVISSTVKSTFNYQISYNLFHDKSNFTKRAFNIMNIVFYLNAGLFIYLATKYFNITLVNPEGIKASLLFSSFIFVVYSLRYIVCKIVGYISNTQKIYSEYIHNISIYARVTGLALIPFLIAIPYTDYRITPVAVFAGAAVIIFSYILRIIRGIKIFIIRKVSLLYLFLYLCTLEFIPVLVFVKYLSIS